jgi:uracil-DNA glycosylase
VCIVGQAPGTRVHATGLPFNDRSGDRLRDWMQVSRDVFYDDRQIAILPMGFCFPGQDAKGGDLPPRPECAAHWRADLLELMPQFELILLIGQYAQRWHLKERRKRTLTETVRHWRDYTQTEQDTAGQNAAANQPALLPLPHPSWRNNGWLKKNAFFVSEVLPFLRREIRRLTKGASLQSNVKASNGGMRH